MKASDLLKDKNKLLMGIPIILGMLFIYVFFIHAGQSEETQQKEDASAFFEPTAQESEKAGDKLEAYKRDELEKQEEERIRKESDVKGSDFYFDLHNREEEYDERKLERIRRMQGDPYSEVICPPLGREARCDFISSSVLASPLVSYPQISPNLRPL